MVSKYVMILLLFLSLSIIATPRILVLCPCTVDYRELNLIKGYDYIFHSYATAELESLLAPGSRSLQNYAVPDIAQELHNLNMLYGNSVDAVISTDDFPGTILAALFAEANHLVGSSPQAVLACQHKYVSRCIQHAIVPQATPLFVLIKRGSLPPFDIPFFIKPQRACFSVGASPVRSSIEYVRAIERAVIPQGFCDPFNTLLAQYTHLPLINSQQVLAEEFLSGHQATIEGFVCNGCVVILGIVDSIMIPGTLSFDRFEYPSSLPDIIQKRMSDIATRCMYGFAYRNGFFNIEFFYNPSRDALSIIEINPRLSYQFADLYEKVDGTNSYQLLLDCALGKKPIFKRGCGKYTMAASCVMRCMTDALVVSVSDDYTEIYRRYPDVRIEITVKPGKYLSEYIQDENSFFYGTINCGGKNRDEITKIFHDCRARLPLVLKSNSR